MKQILAGASVVLMAFAFTGLDAHADRRGPPPTHAGWQSECGSCHTAFPARTLDASSWQRVMATLDRHYGVDASLDAATARDIGRFLQVNAATKAGRSTRGPELPRVTGTDWFRHEHRKVEPAVWKRPAVKAANNCTACHPGADRGDFEEDDVRIPR